MGITSVRSDGAAEELRREHRDVLGRHGIAERLVEDWIHGRRRRDGAPQAQWALRRSDRTVLPRNFGVNTVTFSGGTVSLNDSLKTGFMVVDGATAHLKLNGHYVGPIGRCCRGTSA